MDGVTRGARVQVISKTGRPTILRQLLYPLEVKTYDLPELVKEKIVQIMFLRPKLILILTAAMQARDKDG